MMANTDYFIKMHQMLITQKRFKEAIDLCQYAITSVEWPTQITYLCQALWRYTLAENYSLIGDACSAKEAFKDFLAYKENTIIMSTLRPDAQTYIDDMYIQACANMGQLAVSYEEYDRYVQKSKAIRPLTQMQTAQMENVNFNRDHGQSWCDNIVSLLALAQEKVETSGNGAQMHIVISLASLILAFAQIDPPIETLENAIGVYSTYVCRFVGDSLVQCAQQKIPANPDNYRFIFDKALSLVGEYADDIETHNAAQEALNMLNEAKSKVVDNTEFFDLGFDTHVPSFAPNYIPPRVLENEIKQHASTAPANATPKALRMAAIISKLLIWVGIIGMIWAALTYFK